MFERILGVLNLEVPPGSHSYWSIFGYLLLFMLLVFLSWLLISLHIY